MQRQGEVNLRGVTTGRHDKTATDGRTDMKCKHCGKSIYGQYLNSTRSPADRVYISYGNHPLLKKASELVELAKGYEDEVRELQTKHRKRLRPVYSHKVSIVNPKDHQGWISSRVPKGSEMIMVTSTLENEDIFEKHMKRYGSISMSPDEGKRSVRYYRKHGLLFYDGGGHCTLTAEQPCSDEEWEQIKQGDIPKKFIR